MIFYLGYGKSPKILNTKVSDKMAYANSADPDQTEGAVLSESTLFAIPLLYLWHLSESRFLLGVLHRRWKFANFCHDSMQNHLS